MAEWRKRDEGIGTQDDPWEPAEPEPRERNQSIINCKEGIFQVIGSAKNCLDKSHSIQPLSAEPTSMQIKAVLKMANSCTKPKCQDLFITHSLFKKITS